MIQMNNKIKNYQSIEWINLTVLEIIVSKWSRIQNKNKRKNKT